MIVVDTNVLLAAVIRGASSQMTLAVRRSDSQWIAPFLLRSEFLNALAKYVVIAKTMDRDRALKAFKRGLDMLSSSGTRVIPLKYLTYARSLV